MNCGELTIWQLKSNLRGSYETNAFLLFTVQIPISQAIMATSH